ncbi:hypothetical protein E4U22_004155 [Claviceps purpurea]|nr:hypothetical protein E4U12_006324 [Claviceps purpurea]KAG6165419.1 hypothetical protein E4U51_004358 [Claviceps purpurea]KAG6182305.1 hypothetical protein E4U36_003431 [Claviceps purpurea]KAG6187027.1 hypothetical protein E4U10_005609 [Claviceps purpurea]KAG6216456.1 hypothetical protein E4U34_005096 [Claviceps purpurea]
MATASRWLRGRLATVLPSEATASTSSKDAIAIANAKPASPQPSGFFKVQANHVIIIKPALMGRPHHFVVPRSAKSVP